LNNKLDDLAPESCKTVSVGNHKRDDSSAHRSFQYGPQSFPFEIDSRANVFDDFSVGISLSHVLGLPLKIVPLLRT